MVTGQRLIQSTTDVFLGWERLVRPVDGGTSDYYFRQLWDWKGSADVDAMDPPAMATYGRICGRILARAHARTGDAVAIAAYLGKGATFTRSVGDFSRTYAEVNDADHARFLAAVGPTAG